MLSLLPLQAGSPYFPITAQMSQHFRFELICQDLKNIPTLEGLQDLKCLGNTRVHERLLSPVQSDAC